MKRNLIAAAVVSLCTVSAFAAPLNPNAPGTYQTYYIAGASAQGAAVTSAVTGIVGGVQGTSALFANGADVVTITQACSNSLAANAATQFNANCDKVTMWFGVGLNGSNLLVIYNNADGSFAGMNQLINKGGAAAAKLDYAQLTANSDGSFALNNSLGLFHGFVPSLGNGITFTGSGKTYTFTQNGWANNQPTTGFVFLTPDLALADVHNNEAVAGAFAPGHTLYGTTSLAAGQIASTTTGLETFGVAVNPALYSQLQNLQFGLTTTPAALDLTVAHIPSLTTAQYASLISESSATKSAAQFLSFFQAGNADATPLTLERRVILSGTQASSGIHFLANPCSGGFNGGGAVPANLANGDANPGVFNIVENSATGDVTGALSTGTDYRIGVISLEKNHAMGQNTYNFVKLNGVSPNYSAYVGTTLGAPLATPIYDAKGRINSSLGLYDYAVEMSANTNSGNNNPVHVNYSAAFIAALSNSTLHDLVGVSYLDNAQAIAAGNTATGTDGTDFKQARFDHAGNNCSAMQANQ